MQKKSEIIDTIFQNRKIDQLSDYLDDHPNIDIITLVDSNGNTVLHQLAFQGHLDIIKLFVKQTRKQLRKKGANKSLYQKDQHQQLTNWMNSKNNQGFTPLLYASYSGHLDILKYLTQQYGVNQKITTNTGLNVLHLAAQKNMVLPFLFFKNVININDKDNVGSTALHWAAYMNSQNVVCYILSLKQFRCIDDIDTDGNTALSLAVMYGNTRVVRRLLFQGANRYIKNSFGQNALKIAQQNNFRTIQKMLSQQFSFLDLFKFYCNIKIQYKPTHRSWTMPIVFLMTLLVNVGIMNILVVFKQLYFFVTQCIIVGIMLILYLSLLKGKTVSQRRSYQQFLQSSSQKSLKKVCWECNNYMPKRGIHCQICNICIKQYDHHCTWINNCVGKKNIGRFVTFLFFLILSLGIIGLISFLSGISIIFDERDIYSEWFSFRLVYKQFYQKICILVLFGINFATSLFLIPVLVLFLQQIKNLLKNRTTHQMMKNQSSTSNEMKSKFKKYNSKVSLRNCKLMCRDNVGSFTDNTVTTYEDIISTLPSSKQ